VIADQQHTAPIAGASVSLCTYHRRCGTILEILGPKVARLNDRQVRRYGANGVPRTAIQDSSQVRCNRIKYDFNPSDFPILPGSADVYLIPSTAADDHPTLAFRSR